jgi:hypothetical protein
MKRGECVGSLFTRRSGVPEVIQGPRIKRENSSVEEAEVLETLLRTKLCNEFVRSPVARPPRAQSYPVIACEASNVTEVRGPRAVSRQAIDGIKIIETNDAPISAV